LENEVLVRGANKKVVTNLVAYGVKNEAYFAEVSQANDEPIGHMQVFDHDEAGELTPMAIQHEKLIQQIDPVHCMYGTSRQTLEQKYPITAGLGAWEVRQMSNEAGEQVVEIVWQYGPRHRRYVINPDKSFGCELV